MLVRKSQFQRSVEELSLTGVRGLDTESTGLRESDRLFCVTIYEDNRSYYFNFHDYPSLYDACLPISWVKDLAPAFLNPHSTWFIHNAKHDLKYLSFEGLEIRGQVVCTEVQERIFKNNYMKGQYNLAACAKRRGLQKDELVDEYIMENKLYDKIQVPGKKKAVLLKHFEQVPFDVISLRAEGDAKLHYQIGMDQQVQILTQSLKDRERVSNTIQHVSKNEIALTPVLFKMERWGIKIDPEYTKKALAYEESQVELAKREFTTATGIPFSDGRNCLVSAFRQLGEAFPTTEKGNPSFTEDVLEGMQTPVAQMVKKIRKHQKKANTYFSSFLYFADQQGIIHPNWRQGGTETGRMSASDPNLQNVPKEDDDEDHQKPFLVRSCFVPSFPGWPLVSLDYMQQEFRLMVDYADEAGVIKALKEGMDPHEITKNMVGCTRREAKVLNFGIPYGMGKDKLAGLLNRTPQEAQEFKDAWFGKMPMVKRFFKKAAMVGRQRGYVRNWLGRRCYLDDPDFDYILPNHIIQGGCADVIKVAMVQIYAYFTHKQMRTQMNLQVHDELAFNWHPSEYQEVSAIKKIMENAYVPRSGMNLTCSVDHSFKSWGAFDKIKGEPK